MGEMLSDEEQFELDLKEAGYEKLGTRQVEINGKMYEFEIGKEGEFFVASGLGDVEGANTQGHSMKELEKNMVDAGSAILEAIEEIAARKINLLS